jgi:hypothetical protein
MTTMIAKYIGKKILGESRQNNFGKDVSFSAQSYHKFQLTIL